MNFKGSSKFNELLKTPLVKTFMEIRSTPYVTEYVNVIGGRSVRTVSISYTSRVRFGGPHR